MNKDVERFLSKTKFWKNEIQKLRSILLKTPLQESFKWGKPCYGVGNANIVIIQPFKSYLGMMFFKGTLLNDSQKILIDNGPNSRAGRRFEFSSIIEIVKLEKTIIDYINQAIEIEKSGKKIVRKKVEKLPDELVTMFQNKPNFKTAFAKLTPGRQRAYILFFSGAKQSETRAQRIEKNIARIMQGKGIHDK